MEAEDMRLLFTMDRRDYDPNGRVVSRPSARAVILRGALVAMVHSRLYNYYKFPGGGIEPEETREQALIREVSEEAGLAVIPGTIRPYGRVRRIQKGELGDVFLQENYYFLCETEEEAAGQSLDPYEKEEGFSLVWIDPREAIRVNREEPHGPKDQSMLEREARVLELLLAEDYFGFCGKGGLPE